MKVDIRYKLLGSANWVQYPISPEQYFEPLAESRSYQWDDVPRHLHAAEFLPVSPDGISETELKIWDPDERLRLTIGEVFWNAGLNRIIQRTEENFTLLIVQLRQGEAPATYHTIRLNREGDGRLLLEQMQLAVTNHGDIPGPSHVVSLPALIRNTEPEGPVSIRYRLLGSTEWRIHTMTPTEYYKPQEHDTDFEWDDAPKHEYASDYLRFLPGQIVTTEVRLADGAGRRRREISEVLWNHGQNRIVHRVDEQNVALEIQVRIEEKPRARHTIRLVRNTDDGGLLEHEVGIEEVGGEERLSIAHRRL